MPVDSTILAHAVPPELRAQKYPQPCGHRRGRNTRPLTCEGGEVKYGRISIDDLLPLRQTYDMAFRVRHAKIAFVSCNESAIRHFQRDSMVVGVEEMLFEFHCELHSSL